MELLYPKIIRYSHSLMHLTTMKPRKCIRSSNDDVGLDRLSEMPVNVILHVLSLMPTRDAVRTMLLRRFGNLWTLLPDLTFSFNDFYATPDDDGEDDDTSEEEQRLRSEAFSRFARYVRNVLMLHRRPTIVSFNLFIGDRISHLVDPCLMDDVRLWVKFAVDREVTHLAFIFDYHDNFALPQCIFTSQSVVTLVVAGGMLVHYKHQPQLHMGSLRKLYLLSVHGSNEAYNQLISACSSLEELMMRQPRGLLNLNITAPSVSILKLEDIFDVHDRPFTLNCPHVKFLDISFGQLRENASSSFPVDVIDVSSLQHVTVGRLPVSWSGPVTTAFLRHFRNASFLKLSSVAFEQICLKKADIPQTRWQCLVFWPDWDDERCLQVTTEFLTSSVNLKLLVIGGGQCSDNLEGHGSELSTSCVLLPQLKHVLFIDYQTGCEAQLQVVEFILRNAVVLESVNVWLTGDRVTTVEQLELVKQVSRMKRASANATVNFF